MTTTVHIKIIKSPVSNSLTRVHHEDRRKVKIEQKASRNISLPPLRYSDDASLFPLSGQDFPMTSSMDLLTQVSLTNQVAPVEQYPALDFSSQTLSQQPLDVHTLLLKRLLL